MRMSFLIILIGIVITDKVHARLGGQLACQELSIQRSGGADRSFFVALTVIAVHRGVLRAYVVDHNGEILHIRISDRSSQVAVQGIRLEQLEQPVTGVRQLIAITWYQVARIYSKHICIVESRARAVACRSFGVIDLAAISSARFFIESGHIFCVAVLFDIDHELYRLDAGSNRPTVVVAVEARLRIEVDVQVE